MKAAIVIFTLCSPLCFIETLFQSVFPEVDFAILTLLWPLVQAFSYLTGKVIVGYFEINWPYAV